MVKTIYLCHCALIDMHVVVHMNLRLGEVALAASRFEYCFVFSIFFKFNLRWFKSQGRRVVWAVETPLMSTHARMYVSVCFRKTCKNRLKLHRFKFSISCTRFFFFKVAVASLPLHLPLRSSQRLFLHSYAYISTDIHIYLHTYVHTYYILVVFALFLLLLFTLQARSLSLSLTLSLPPTYFLLLLSVINFALLLNWQVFQVLVKLLLIYIHFFNGCPNS